MAFFCVDNEPSTNSCLHENPYLANVHHRAGRRDGVQSIHNRMGAAYIRLYDEPSTNSCLHENLYLATVHHRMTKS